MNASIITEDKNKYFPNVAEKPVYFTNPVENCDELEVNCPNHKAIVDLNTNHTYCIASRNYQIVEHEEVIRQIDEIIAGAPEFGTAKRRFRTYDDGGKLYAKWLFPEIEYDIGKGTNKDIVNPEIWLKTSYDQGWKFSLFFGAFRLVCSNGLVIGEKFAHYSKKHTTSLDLERAVETIHTGMNKFSEQTEIWKTWLDRETTSTEADSILQVFQKKEVDQLVHMPEVVSNVQLKDHVVFTAPEKEDEKGKFEVINPLTYFMMFQIVTQFITHHVAGVRQANLQGRMANIIR